MIAGIYKILNPIGEIYIGQSWDIERRLTEYKNLRCKSQPKLFKSLENYGFWNHEFEIVHEFKGDQQFILDQLEYFFWAINKVDHCMLNLKVPMGSHGKMSDETKLKMKLSHTGSKHSPETISKLRIIHKGRKKPNLKQFGELNHRSKLTTENVLEIKKLLNDCVKQRDIAKMYCVSYKTISQIKLGTRWKHLNYELRRN